MTFTGSTPDDGDEDDGLGIADLPLIIDPALAFIIDPAGNFILAL